MGKARTKAQRKRPQTKDRQDVTAERAAKNDFQSAGMARKVIRPLVSLAMKGDISQADFEALDYYGQQATLAETPSSRDSCDFSVRGGTGRGEPSLAIQSAKRETSRMEALLGPLKHIAFAVCVKDMSLTQWACEEYGARERIEGGKVIELVPRCKDGVFFARWDLKFAAARLRA